MNHDKIIDKIKKCLALSKSSNANEAAAALRQAQKLMAEYNISVTDVDAAQASEAAAKSGCSAKPALWESWLANICADAFACRTIFSQDLFGGKARWLFIGINPNPELSQYAFEVMFRQIKRDRTKYIAEQLRRVRSAARKTQRADIYCLAWVEEASTQVAAVSRTEDENRAVQAFMAKRHPSLKDLNPRDRNEGKKHHEQDIYAGNRDGANARLHRGVNGEEQKRLT